MRVPALDLNRLYHLMRRDILQNKKNLLVTALVICGVIFGNNLLNAGINSGGQGSDGLFSFLLTLGGFIITSIAFSDIHHKTKGPAFFMTPASILEKYLGRLLLTSLGWAAALTVLYLVTSVISSGVSILLFGRSHPVLWNLTSGPWNLIGGYLVTQALFAFGSIYFKNAAFVKVVGMSVVIAIGYSVFIMIAGRIVFLDQISGFLPTEAEMMAIFSEPGQGVERFLEMIELFGKVMYWGVVPIFFWYLGYRRLAETEV